MATSSSSTSKPTKRKIVTFNWTVDDVDEDELFEAKVRTNATTVSYEGIIKKLKGFLKVPENLEIPSDLLNDKKLRIVFPWIWHWNRSPQIAIQKNVWSNQVVQCQILITRYLQVRSFMATFYEIDRGKLNVFNN